MRVLAPIFLCLLMTAGCSKPAVPAKSNSALSFMGYECAVDCSGHKAGYAWANDNEIDDQTDCAGNSDSFNEGCMAFVKESATLEVEARNEANQNFYRN